MDMLRNSHMACELFLFFWVLRDFASITPPPQAWRRRAEEDLHFFPTSPLIHCSFHAFPQTPWNVPFNGDDGEKARSHRCSIGIFHQSAKAEDEGLMFCWKNLTHRQQPDNKDSNIVSHRLQPTTIKKKLPQNVMQRANVKLVYRFSFANMEICLTVFGEGLLQPHIHGLVNCPMETTSHIKMEFSFPFREKNREARPSSGPKPTAPLWSHLQKGSNEDVGSLTLSPDEIQLQKGGGGSAAAVLLHWSYCPGQK